MPKLPQTDLQATSLSLFKDLPAHCYNEDDRNQLKGNQEKLQFGTFS